MSGAYVGALVVAAVRFAQSREKKLLPLMVLFVLLTAAHVRDAPSRAASWIHLAAGFAGMVTTLVIAPYPPSRAH